MGSKSAGEITKHTLMPLGLVVVIVGAAWAAAWAVSADRQSLINRVGRTEVSIDLLMESDRSQNLTLQYLRDGMIRMETKLGTLPADLGGSDLGGGGGTP